MVKAYKYKLKLTVRQEKFLSQVFGCTRFIYNWGLEKKMKTYADTKKSLSYTPLAAMLTELKKADDYKWLNDVPIMCLQQSLRCLESAYTRYFREKKGYPKFKSKRGSKPCAKYVGNVDFDFENWKAKIPKMGWVNICHNRAFDVAIVKLGTLTVTKDKCGDYWCSIVVHTEEEKPARAKLAKSESVGIDLGIKDYAIMSDGTKYGNPKYLEKEQKKLAKLQRRHSRKAKGSKRREKARIKLARCHRRIKNRRCDFIHKLTTGLMRGDATTFVMEDLNVEGMLKNHRLANSIASAAWSEFRRQIEYKAENCGKNVLFIGRYEPSSKLCHVCGYKNDGLALKDRTWVCPECGAVLDRDVNAAINIRNIAFERQNLIGVPSKIKHPSGSGAEDVETRGYAVGEASRLETLSALQGKQVYHSLGR